MTSAIGQYLIKKIFKEYAQDNSSREDPYFETVPETRRDGRPTGKMKKRRKALPPGISEHDGKVLAKVKRRAYRLDMSLCNCCGVRFGWSSVIGLFPLVGDYINAYMASRVMDSCEEIEGGLPKSLKWKMRIYIAISFGIGFWPLVGDLIDALLWRVNTKIASILEDYLRDKGEKALKTQGHSQHLSDPSYPGGIDQDLDDGRPPQYAANHHHGEAHAVPTSPSRTQPPEERRSRFGNGNTDPDIERGEGLPLQDRSTRNPHASRKNRR